MSARVGEGQFRTCRPLPIALTGTGVLEFLSELDLEASADWIAVGALITKGCKSGAAHHILPDVCQVKNGQA